MRITIFGATGLLGKALMREWKEDEVTGLASADGDIRNAEQVLHLVERRRPDWIVLAAAYTDVDGCETDRDLAYDVNCQGAVNVARAAKQQGARLIFLSTDYVFDGAKTIPYTTDDPRSPRSVYGESKAEAEVQLLRVLPECCIVRTSWLFGTGGKCFPDTILNLAASRPQLDVVGDQRGSPTYVVDLARALIQLCRQQASGLVHATNRGECSWYEFAREIIARAGLDTVVHETTSDKFVRPAERPKYSVLSPESLERRGIAMPGWQDALQRYLAERAFS
ncbi:MAG TPA: dTDP-4-dehydrorhamnose reductase [Terriglobales bacterium]|nr:dTDP-4-dehydrorhamnose reductase [Terriglobales bacterium]